MFTGIIRHIGVIDAIKEENEAVTLIIKCGLSKDLSEGDSVAVNGVCLTVIENNDLSWTARLMAETLRKTNLGKLQKKDAVNLERPLRGDQTLDGHFVQGHIDDVCEITEIKLSGEDKIFTFNPPGHVMGFLIPKGSVALNGVSLTVVDVNKNNFTVSMMPYTLNHTTFGKANQGDKVNIEIDMIGKYIVSYLEKLPAKNVLK